jgi:LmbE family N-acetylglucosaminyl deacetylase
VSLPRLDQGRIRTITSLDGSGTTYTRAQLIGSLRALLITSRATVVHTLDYSGSWAIASKDHPDHRAVAYLTRAASQRYPAKHTLRAYLGYPTFLEKPDISGRALAQKAAAFYTYAPFDGDICQTPKTCVGNYEAAWLKRQYVVDTRTVSAARR